MKKRNVLVLIILINLMLLACVGSEAIKKIAEPIDKQGCKLDCKRAGMEFYGYEYYTNTCKGKTLGGEIVILYGLEAEK